MKLANETVTVELKNGSVVQGTVESVDSTMNTHMRNVKVTIKGKNPVPMEFLTIRGNTLRYVLLPDHLNLDSLLIDDGFQPRSFRGGSGQRGGRGRGARGGRGGGGGRGRGRGGGRGGAQF